MGGSEQTCGEGGEHMGENNGWAGAEIMTNEADLRTTDSLVRHLRLSTPRIRLEDASDMGITESMSGRSVSRSSSDGPRACTINLTTLLSLLPPLM